MSERVYSCRASVALVAYPIIARLVSERGRDIDRERVRRAALWQLMAVSQRTAKPRSGTLSMGALSPAEPKP